jgi:methylenetetrahydrofolate reductase (NADPH)
MDRTAQGLVPGLERLMSLDEAIAPEGRPLARVFRAAAFELIPLASAYDRAGAIPAGSTVTITVSPTRGLDPTLELAESLAERGFAVVPHVAARAVRDRVHLTELVARLDGAGLRRVFVIGGDGEDAGLFPDALSLLRAVEELGHRFESVGIAGYPQGHPSIATDALWLALLAKQSHADYVTTQLCFDTTATARWVDDARRLGLTLPIHLGLPGPGDVTRIARIAARVGVADAARYLRKNRGLVGAILRRRAFRPDRLLEELASTIADPDAKVDGLHVFTFNQVDDAVAWRARALASPAIS